MEALKHLPDVSGRKYGTIDLGYDRVDTIRMEISTLETLAALICGCSREALTLPKVQWVTADLQARMAALTPETRAEWRDEDPQVLLALAVAMRQP